MWDGAQNVLNIAWVHAELTLYFLHFPFKGAEVARQSDINIASEWGPLAPSNKWSVSVPTPSNRWELTVLGKFTEGSWYFFHFYRLISPDDPTHTKRYSTLILRSHLHKCRKRASRDLFPRELFFRDSSFRTRQISSRMLYVYTLSKKIDTIRISVIRDIKKIFKKINDIEDVKKRCQKMLHNNNAEKLWTNRKKKHSFINPFFIPNQFIDFSASTWI